MKLTLNPSQNIYFTSDTHFNHKNICRGVSDWGGSDKCRDFDTLNHMNDSIVTAINSMVTANDYLIHLGDWSFGGFEQIQKFRDRLYCKNIILVLGNHDHHIARNKDNIQDLFHSVHNYLNLDLRLQQIDGSVKKHKFILFHFPIMSWDEMGQGRIHLHGHVHLSHKQVMAQKGKTMDVGMDGNNLFPYSLRDILGVMKHREIENPTNFQDHHIEGFE
jgi:calcineurin-like phosphoesterase family protein